MNGTIALHGGGEFLPGDEPFLAALIEAAPTIDGRVRALVIPTAAARGRPKLAAANGIAALTRVGASIGRVVEAEALLVVDAAGAADARLAERVRAADLIYLPGGDPDLIPTLFPASPVWAAVLDAVDGGAALAGASAGAMALGTWTWTPSGGIAGLDVVPGIVVVPHADAASWTANIRRFGAFAPTDVDVLGIGERTGVLIDPTGPWRVVGEGEVRWLEPDVRDPEAAQVLSHLDTFTPRDD